MAAPAKQAGSFIGKDIAAVVAGPPHPKYQYLDLVSMAIVDESSAVADLRGLQVPGPTRGAALEWSASRAYPRHAITGLSRHKVDF